MHGYSECHQSNTGIMVHVYFQRRRTPDDTDWQTRVIATSEELVYELRDIANFVIKFDNDNKTSVIHDPKGWCTEETEATFAAAAYVFGYSIMEKAEYVMRKPKYKTSDVVMREVYPGSPKAPFRR